MSAIPFGDLLIRLLGDSSQFEKMLKTTEKNLAEIQEKVNKAASKIESVGSSFSKYLTAPIVAFAGLSVKSFGDFEDAMVKSTSVMGGMSEGLREAMERTAMLSRDPIEAAKAYETLARAGENAEQSIRLLGVAEDFSKANSMDMTRATEVLTGVQRTLGLRSKDAEKNMASAARISDVLTKASLMSGSSVEELGEALQHRGAAAMRQFNIPLEQGVALLASLSQQGIKGSRAGSMLEQILAGAKRGGPGSEQAIARLAAMKEMTTQYGMALDKAGGTVTQIAEQRANSYEGQLRALHSSMQKIQIEIGSFLIPYLKVLNEKVADAIKWWRSLETSQKKWVTIAALVIAAIGPMLVVLSTMMTAIAGIIGLISVSSAMFLVWAGVAAVLVVALGVVTDAILQMTGRGNLGIIDLMNNFRIGGFKISTWMTTVWLIIFDAWEDVSTRIVTGMKTLELVFRDFGGEIYRTFAGAWHKAYMAYLDFQYAIHALTTDEVTILGTLANDKFNAKLTASLDAAEQRYREYYTSIDTLNRESADRRQAYNQEIDRLFAADAAQNTLDKAKKKIVAEKDGKVKVPGLDLPQFEEPDFSDVRSSKKESGGGAGGNNGFLVQSLRRFSLDGPGGLSGTFKQEVTDKAVASKLDTLIDVTRQKSTVATLGD